MNRVWMKRICKWTYSNSKFSGKPTADNSRKLLSEAFNAALNQVHECLSSYICARAQTNNGFPSAANHTSINNKEERLTTVSVEVRSVGRKVSRKKVRKRDREREDTVRELVTVCRRGCCCCCWWGDVVLTGGEGATNNKRCLRRWKA